MAPGLHTTFRALTHTRNEAAVDLLIAALESPLPHVRDEAVRALLIRKDERGLREIVHRFERSNSAWLPMLSERRDLLTGPLREALLSDHQDCFDHAIDATKTFGDYALMPTLVNIVEHASAERRAASAEAALVLARKLYEELVGPRDYSIRRDPQLTRRFVLSCLERSVTQFCLHQRRELVEAFLILVGRDNVALQSVLRDPRHAAHAVMLDLLGRGSHPGIMRLLISCLDDVHPPRAITSALAQRKDPRFVEKLLTRFGEEHSETFLHNLRRAAPFSWLPDETPLLLALPEELQARVVPLALAADLPKRDVLQVVETLYHEGHPIARAAAITGLAKLAGDRANRLIMTALDDPDPAVQVAAVHQLQPRGVPGTLGRLVALLDSPHASVRSVAREYLGEFSARRFLDSFDTLSMEARRVTGKLVLKVDPDFPLLLRKELRSADPVARIRALEIIEQVPFGDTVVEEAVALLDDADPLVQAKAEEVLSGKRAPPFVAPKSGSAARPEQIPVSDSAPMGNWEGRNAGTPIPAAEEVPR